MNQKLILPINQAKLTASMKTDAYQEKYGFPHYGIDLVSAAGNRTVYASGYGTVLRTGWDNVVGNVVAVLYPAAYNRVRGEARSVVFRYFHLESIAVKEGQAVNKDVVLGIYGRTGYLNMANHLHLEADRDTLYPLYTPTVKSSNLLGGSLVGANDKTMDSALEWLFRKSGPPDQQTFTTSNDRYIRESDQSIPAVETGCEAEAVSAGEGSDQMLLEKLRDQFAQPSALDQDIAQAEEADK